MPGLMILQAADLVKILGLAYGQHLKKSGKNAPLTIEMHDLTQKYWNILVDSSRCMKGMGITSLGSRSTVGYRANMSRWVLNGSWRSIVGHNELTGRKIKLEDQPH